MYTLSEKSEKAREVIITFLIALTLRIIFYFGKSLSYLLLVIIMFIAVYLVLKVNEYITKKGNNENS
ncbi:hypothetical protein DX926_09165 [Bacillus atrophaeus]|nr:hypothetical protein DX926_09165 [Bacillus atrophaeus]